MASCIKRAGVEFHGLHQSFLMETTIDTDKKKKDHILYPWITGGKSHLLEELSPMETINERESVCV
jgi:hypothetical protein